MDVEMLLKVRGLKPKSGFQKFLSNFSKHGDPSFLCANAEFTKWELSATSLALTVRVQTEKPRKKRHGKKHTAEAASSSSDLHTEVFDFKIRRFPSDIHPETAKLEIMQPSGRSYSFIVLTMRKLDNSVSWKSFQADHGTLDASNI